MPLMMILKPPLLVKVGFIRKVSTWFVVVIIVFQLWYLIFETLWDIDCGIHVSMLEGLRCCEYLQKETVDHFEKLFFHLSAIFGLQHLQYFGGYQIDLHHRHHHNCHCRHQAKHQIHRFKPTLHGKYFLPIIMERLILLLLCFNKGGGYFWMYHG